jgi:hypothetical protein
MLQSSAESDLIVVVSILYIQENPFFMEGGNIAHG